MWDDPAGDATNLAWLRSLIDDLEPSTTGHYVAEADLLASDTRASRSFAPANWERLHEIRRTVDPDGIFAAYLAPADEPDLQSTPTPETSNP